MANQETGFVDDLRQQQKTKDESTEMNFCPVPYLSMIGSAEGDKVVDTHENGEERHREPKVFHPYIMYLTKKLYIEDAKERLNFARQELSRLHVNPQLLQSIWFTGEATFYTTGLVEVHNMRYSSKNKIEELLPEEASSDRVIVWAAMNYNELLGPYFFFGDLTSDNYQMMLREFFFDIRKQISAFEKPIFMHDDSPAHRKLDVQEFLEHEVPHHWIGVGSNYSNWPHHSPDIIPLNYFLWGFIKSQIYKTPIESDDIVELRHRINSAFKKVTKEMLKEAVEDFKVRLEKLLHVRGALVGTSINVRYEHLPSTSINRSNNCFFDWKDDDSIQLDA
uniref:Tc1-like transposase DDE domain-containing protein n=1 Tax=Acrobeloides nanus TaxID=290746 RepID=A0A914CNM1_9BILA